jgi:hypothetical protein
VEHPRALPRDGGLGRIRAMAPARSVIVVVPPMMSLGILPLHGMQQMADTPAVRGDRPRYPRCPWAPRSDEHPDVVLRRKTEGSWKPTEGLVMCGPAPPRPPGRPRRVCLRAAASIGLRLLAPISKNGETAENHLFFEHFKGYARRMGAPVGGRICEPIPAMTAPAPIVHPPGTQRDFRANQAATASILDRSSSAPKRPAPTGMSRCLLPELSLPPSFKRDRAASFRVLQRVYSSSGGCTGTVSRPPCLGAQACPQYRVAGHPQHIPALAILTLVPRPWRAACRRSGTRRRRPVQPEGHGLVLMTSLLPARVPTPALEGDAGDVVAADVFPGPTTRPRNSSSAPIASMTAPTGSAPLARAAASVRPMRRAREMVPGITACLSSLPRIG